MLPAGYKWQYEWKIIDIVFNMGRMPRKVLAGGILFVYSVLAKQEPQTHEMALPS